MTLRAGLLGLGMMGRHHARVLRSLEGVDLVGVADPAGDLHGAAVGIPVVERLDDLLALGLDYCTVAVPTRFHDEAGTTLALAGVHALIEKPLAGSHQQAMDLANLFDRASLVGAVGHIERYNAALQEMRRRIRAGQIGRILQISTSRQGPFPSRIADVGVVKDLASHDIDLTQWVTGARYNSVSASATHVSGRQHEDMIAVTAQLEGGIIANHLVNWVSPAKERRTTVVGELGMLEADTLRSDLTFYANASVQAEWDELSHFRGVAEGDVTRFAFAKPEPLRLEHATMRDAVEGDTAADIVSMRHGATVLRVCEAIIASATTGTTVRLSEE